MGARASVLVGALLRHGGVAPRHAPLVLAMLFSAAARAPFRLLEGRAHRRLARKGTSPSAPVFIIGHWRSGTTHLHNLMGRSPIFGHISPLAAGLPDEILTLGTWCATLFERALPEDRHVDQVEVRPDSPQEDEIPLANLQPLSVFHALYFPKRFRELFDRGVFFDGRRAEEIGRWAQAARGFADKISLQQGGRSLLIKNPVYTARIARLREIWPDARFVHIRRNPYDVFASTRRYYATLLQELALQTIAPFDMDEFVLNTFVRLMDSYEAQRTALPENALVEISYEGLRREPIAVLEGLHERLGLPGWSEAEPYVRDYLDDVSGYRVGVHELSAAERAAVDGAWTKHIERWAALDR